MLFDDNRSYEGGLFEKSTAPAVKLPANNGKATIRVIGVGGAGNNAVNRMIEANITSAEYIAVNTDAQILACNLAPTKIQIGAQRTKGLGAGAEPEIGREAAEESKDELSRVIEGTDLLFITAGMGGGTGTGAAPVIAKLAKDKGILTVAVITEPFNFEGRRRRENALKGIDNIRKYVDTLILIPNEKIKEVVPKNATFQESLRVADDVLRQGIRGIADLIVTPALINLDFADVRTTLKEKGLAHMGVGVAKGENRIVEAVRLAVNCPLLETTIEGASGVIINIVGGNDLTLNEVDTAVGLVHSVVDFSANIIFGACIDENMCDEVQVTVIATGFPSVEEIRAEAAARPTSDVFRMPYAPQQPAAPAQPVVPPMAPQAPVYQQPVQPAPQPEVYATAYAPQPAPAPAAAPQQPVQPVAPQEAYDDEEPEEEEIRDKKLPPFVQRLLGKKK